MSNPIQPIMIDDRKLVIAFVVAIAFGIVGFLLFKSVQKQFETVTVHELESLAKVSPIGVCSERI